MQRKQGEQCQERHDSRDPSPNSDGAERSGLPCMSGRGCEGELGLAQCEKHPHHRQTVHAPILSLITHLRREQQKHHEPRSRCPVELHQLAQPQRSQRHAHRRKPRQPPLAKHARKPFVEQSRQPRAAPVQGVLRLNFCVPEDVLTIIDNPELINPPRHQARRQHSHDEKQGCNGGFREPRVMESLEEGGHVPCRLRCFLRNSDENVPVFGLGPWGSRIGGIVRRQAKRNKPGRTIVDPSQPLWVSARHAFQLRRIPAVSAHRFRGVLDPQPVDWTAGRLAAAEPADSPCVVSFLRMVGLAISRVNRAVDRRRLHRGASNCSGERT